MKSKVLPGKGVKAKPTLREYCEELKTKAHGLHFRLQQLIPHARQGIEALPSGKESNLAYAYLVSAEAALKEYDPAVLCGVPHPSTLQILQRVEAAIRAKMSGPVVLSSRDKLLEEAADIVAEARRNMELL